MPAVAKYDVTARRADEESTREHQVGAHTDTVPRILCVDDEPAMLAVLTRALGSRFEVVTAEDPVVALLLLEHASDFSVVISDMRMPQMDGAEFLAHVKNIAPWTTRLALTACLERQLTSDEVFGILKEGRELPALRGVVLQHAAGAKTSEGKECRFSEREKEAARGCDH